MLCLALRAAAERLAAAPVAPSSLLLSMAERDLAELRVLVAGPDDDAALAVWAVTGVEASVAVARWGAVISAG